MIITITDYNVVPDALPEDADVVGESWWANPQVVKVTPGQDDDKYIRDLDTNLLLVRMVR